MSKIVLKKEEADQEAAEPEVEVKYRLTDFIGGSSTNHIGTDPFEFICEGDAQIVGLHWNCNGCFNFIASDESESKQDTSC